jgi:hypothetical protein
LERVKVKTLSSRAILVNMEQELDLETAADLLINEARMILPGLQALFGFQMIAVFNTSFKTLQFGEKCLHLSAVFAVVLAIILIMTPAALHRQHSYKVTKSFVEVSSRILLWSMLPLSIATLTDFYLVADLVLNSKTASAILSALLIPAYIYAWYLLPKRLKKR